LHDYPSLVFDKTLADRFDNGDLIVS